RSVNALPRHIPKDVVAIADGRKSLNDFAGSGIDYNEARGDTRHHEQPMIRFVERHRVVAQRQSHTPARRNRMRFPVHHGDLPGSRQVHIDAGTAFFQLERFRVRIKFGLSDLLPVRVQFTERTAPESDINPLARGIVAQVIGVVAILDSLEELQRRAVKYLYRAVLAAGYEQPILVRNVEHSLWPFEPRDCIRAFAGSEIDHLYRIVAKRRNEQALPPNVE